MKTQASGWARACLGLVAASAAVTALADVASSTNYRIRWDTVDGGGGRSMSASYTLDDSVAVVAAGMSGSTNYQLSAGFHSPPDNDADRVRNFMDNCIEDANSDQFDSNSDGFGNACDADLNNDGIVNVIDLGQLKSVFFTADPDADFNNDGIVNAVDLGFLKSRFFGEPGPSGIAP